MLILHGANKDAQNNKEETPLFLAAREGSYEAAKILLENLANKEITDHMDRLPRDVACERMHMDIVQLLEEYIPPSPATAGILNAGTPALLLSNLLSSSSKTKVKKRVRTNNNMISGHRKDSTNDLHTMQVHNIHGSTTCSPSSSKTVKESHTNVNNVPHAQTNIGQMSPVSDGSTTNYFPVASIGDNTHTAGQVFLDCKATAKNLHALSAGQNSVSPNGTVHTSTPIKQRPSLPTSPTHMAAMMAAHQQQLCSHQYPTPPWQPQGSGSGGSPQQHIYLPETPESPGQWSSSSDCSASPLQPKAVLFI